MLLYSTNQKSPRSSLKEAVLKGLAPDGGLYMPARVPVLPEDFFLKINQLSLGEISFEVAKIFLGDEVDSSKLKEIVTRAINFDAPLVSVDENTNFLELWHGSTLAFKDFGAKFMAQLMSYFVSGSDKELTILVATSGDTGSAVAQGFFNLPGIRVIILYPQGKVSEIQEKQLTTMGGNITALEIQGTFDDCQKLVKEAFQDQELNEALILTSANSINIARLVPQSFYYFYAYAQLKDKQKPVIFSVPSGNFGNLTAGLLAKKMGLPVAKFIAATNINDVVPEYLENGEFTPRASVKTYSNAMDVGNPSNFVRILELFDNNLEKIKQDIWGVSNSNEETLEAIKEIFSKYNYLADPHTAVGYLGLKKYREKNSQNTTGIILSTAHPAKFIDVMKKAINTEIKIPGRLEEVSSKEKKATLLENNFEKLKKILLEKR